MFRSLDDFRQKHEYRLSDEWKELHAEGRRRMREHERMKPIVRDGKIIAYRGYRRQPPAEECDRFWAPVSTMTFDLYIPTQKDEQGLEQELLELQRDAELMRKHQTVDYRNE